MTDRELLELAGKAYGYEWRWYCAPVGQLLQIETHNGIWIFWNPLTDDGDALRLAAKLNLSICYTLGDIKAPWGTAMVGFSPWSNSSPIAYVRYQSHEEKLSATRRAITRAAAEIGKDMP